MGVACRTAYVGAIANRVGLQRGMSEQVQTAKSTGLAQSPAGARKQNCRAGRHILYQHSQLLVCTGASKWGWKLEGGSIRERAAGTDVQGR
eukprot:478600-Pelagomonas_calceolata.AAC.3